MSQRSSGESGRLSERAGWVTHSSRTRTGPSRPCRGRSSRGRQPSSSLEWPWPLHPTQQPCLQPPIAATLTVGLSCRGEAMLLDESPPFAEGRVVSGSKGDE